MASSVGFNFLLSVIMAQCLLRCSLAAPARGKKDYTGYSLLRLVPTTNDQLKYLQKLWTAASSSEFQLDFWEPPGFLNRRVEVLVSPTQRDAFIARLAELKLGAETIVTDVQPLIDGENYNDDLDGHTLLGSWGFRAKSQSWFNVARFNRYGTISTYLKELAADHPHLITIKEIGITHEKRPILLAHISGRKTNDGRNKPGLWIDAGIHAREWISPTTAIYFINTLVTRYNSDSEIRALVDAIDWYIVPVLNPDGYEYSHRQDRLWRKNRSPELYEHGRWTCAGVDLNRNFDWHWATAGSSSNTCDDTYHGKRPFSEPETRAARDFLTARKDTIKAYISLHSFSQMWMLPFGHRRQVYAPDHYRILPVAQRAANSVRDVHGTNYQVGTGADLLYSAGGGSEDWAKGRLGIEYSFLLELRPRNGDGFHYGFVMPRKEIIPTAEEIWAGLNVIAKQLRAQYPVSVGGWKA